jgi:facilitated trehalose transporter
MTVSSGALGAFFLLDNEQRLEFGLDWLPLVALVIFMVGYSIGFASVPYVLMGEMLPARYRNILSAAASSFNLMNMFVVIKVQFRFISSV